jgi:ribosomal subunit interface protein
MPFRISGKNLDIGAALRQRVNDRLVEALGKYFDRGYSGHVTVEKDGFGFRTECAIHLDSGVTLESEAMAADAYASADQAAIRMEKQLRRYKRRLKDRHAQAAYAEAGADAGYTIFAPPPEEEEPVDNPPIVAETKVDIPTASVSDAVMLLDLRNTNALMFRNTGTGAYNMVYRRGDGTIGWVEPERAGN